MDFRTLVFAEPMNKEKLKGNVGQLVLLQPSAYRLDAAGAVLPEIRDAWQLGSVSDNVARLTNTRTGHFIDVGLDSVSSYASDPNAQNSGGQHTGILQLKVQIYLQGPRAWVMQTVRPGEALPPPPHATAATLARFTSDGAVHFKNLWDRRIADLWVSLGRRVEEFDRREGNQRGSAGYVARLCGLLKEHIAATATAAVQCAVHVHQDFGCPLDPGVEKLLEAPAVDAVLVFCNGLEGIIARHLGRMSVNREIPRGQLDAERALAQANVANTIRQHFQTLRRIR